MNILRFLSHAEGIGEMSNSRVVLVRILELSRTLGSLKEWRIILKNKWQGKIVPVLKYSTMPLRRTRDWMYKSMFFFSALVAGEWSVSRRGRLTPGERIPGTH
jgi:hypothetical protein